MAGRPPKPTRLKILQGNPGKRALNKKEPSPEIVAPACPSWLPAVAKKEWKRIVPLLESLGLLAKIDMAALAGYCLAYSDLVSSVATLEREGSIIEVPIIKKRKGQSDEVVGTVKRVHPAERVKACASDRMKQFLMQFGLTPASRSRLSVDVDGGKSDPFDDFLKGRSG